MKSRLPLWAYPAALVGLLAAIWLLWWLVLGRADKAARQAATARVGQVVAEKRGAAAVEAGRLIEHHYETTRTIERTRDAGITEIRAAQSDADAGNAARRALCLLDPPSYSRDPRCQVQ